MIKWVIAKELRVLLNTLCNESSYCYLADFVLSIARTFNWRKNRPFSAPVHQKESGQSRHCHNCLDEKEQQNWELFPGPVFVVDCKGNHIWMSAQARDLVQGGPVSETPGLAELLDPSCRQAFYFEIATCAQTGIARSGKAELAPSFPVGGDGSHGIKLNYEPLGGCHLHEVPLVVVTAVKVDTQLQCGVAGLNATNLSGNPVHRLQAAAEAGSNHHFEGHHSAVAANGIAVAACLLEQVRLAISTHYLTDPESTLEVRIMPLAELPKVLADPVALARSLNDLFSGSTRSLPENAVLEIILDRSARSALLECRLSGQAERMDPLLRLSFPIHAKIVAQEPAFHEERLPRIAYAANSNFEVNPIPRAQKTGQ